MKLSVITVNYNDKDGLNKTLLSVIGQSFKDYEYIVIDGGSTDGSLELIRQYSDSITYWVSEKDNGIYNAMNKAIDVAKGEYCIFMNSGDTFNSENTVSQVFSSNPSEDIICGGTQTIEKLKEAPDEITLEYLFSNSICHQCAFIKTSIMAKYRYDEKYRIVADRKFFLQALILEGCSYAKSSVVVVNYDIGGFSANNPVLSRREYDSVLEELIPQRIRMDYGRKYRGKIYGDSEYEKLFYEIGLRNYRRMIYAVAVLLLRGLAIFKSSANFVKDFPRHIR